MKMAVRRMLALTAGLTSLSLIAAPAAGQPVPPGQEGDLAKIVPPVHGRKACSARTYDARHLEKHPKQTVRALLF
jgi:hypothetical protein